MTSPKITACEYGCITVGKRIYRCDVVVGLGDRVQACPEAYNSRGRLRARYMRKLVSQEPEVIILGLGSGHRLKMTKKAIACLERSGVEWRALSTPRACRLFNRYATTHRVIGLFHLGS